MQLPKQLRILLVVGGMAGLGIAQAQPLDILFGHYEVHIDYEPSAANPDSGWQFSISYDEDNDFNDSEGITRLNPADVRLIAAPGTVKSNTAATSRLGAVGTPLWLLPQNNVPGTLFLGFRTVFDSDVFQASVNGFYSPSSLGSIALNMQNVQGSGRTLGGQFAMWESRFDGSLEFHFDTSDGIDGGDRLEPVRAGAHTHYNWGMTRPGTYAATFKASGRLNPWQPGGGQDTSGQATFTFMVPFSSWADGSAALHLGGTGSPQAAVYHAGEQCEYAPNQVALVTQAATIQSTAHAYAFQLDLVTNATAALNWVGISGGAPVQLPSNLELDNPALELMDAHGPGVVSLIHTAPQQVLLSASEPGIYRVTLRTRLNDTDAGMSLVSDPYTLVVLAGLPVDYDYSDYADSFERQHGLSVGALSDPFGDYDVDGVANGIEYQLFWHGLDPVVPDTDAMPRPVIVDGKATLPFLRDTYKDDFQMSQTSLAASYSPNLADWFIWHTQQPHKPSATVFENGVGADAIGRVMQRRLEIQGAAEKAFFQFTLF